MKKMTAQEYLKQTGWDDKNPVVGGALFYGIAELMEKYAEIKLKETRSNEDYGIQLAMIADYLNEELRQVGAWEAQIEDYLHADFRPSIHELILRLRKKNNNY